MSQQPINPIRNPQEVLQRPPKPEVVWIIAKIRQTLDWDLAGLESNLVLHNVEQPLNAMHGTDTALRRDRMWLAERGGAA